MVTSPITKKSAHRKDYVLWCKIGQHSFRASRPDALSCQRCKDRTKYKRKKARRAAQELAAKLAQEKQRAMFDQIEREAEARRQAEAAEARRLQIEEAKRITYERIAQARKEGRPL